MSGRPDQPVLVVNADDLGLAESATAGILRAHERGIVTSASLAVTTSAAEQAVEELPKHPRLGVGLHFCLTAGRPAADPRDVPDLVDRNGYMRWRFTPLLFALRGRRRSSLLAQITHELEAQIVRAKGFGLTLDHINGERHVHLLPGVFELVDRAAREHAIPHIRLIDDIGARYLSAPAKLSAALDGGWVKVSLLSALTRRACRVCTLEGPQHVRYATLLCTGRMYRMMPNIWKHPPGGVTEVAVHPGLPGVENSEIGNDALSKYLESSERRRATEAIERLDPRDTPAKLATFAEVYGAGGHLPGATDRQSSQPTA